MGNFSGSDLLDVDEEKNPVLKVIAIIMGIILILIAFMYSYITGGKAFEIIENLFGHSNNRGISVNYVDVNSLQFKNSTQSVNVPIIDLDKPNMFSKFSYIVHLTPSTPVAGGIDKLEITFKSDGSDLLTLNYSSSDLPPSITFENITLPVESLNTNIQVYMTLISPFAFTNNKLVDNFVYNKILKTNNYNNKQKTAGVKLDTYSKFSTLILPSSKPNHQNNPIYSMYSLPKEGTITIKYPIINQYQKVLPSLVTEDLKKIFDSYYVDTETLITIREIVKNTLTGNYQTYSTISADWILNDASLDPMKKTFDFTFTPVYRVSIKIPYISLKVSYKIADIQTDSGIIRNYLVITGYDDSLEYKTLTGFDNGDLKSLFKSVEVVLNVMNSGFKRNINLGSLNILTGEAVILSDDADVYLYYNDNKISVNIKRDYTVTGFEFKLTPSETLNIPKPLVTPKVEYIIGSSTIKISRLPMIRISHIDNVQFDSSIVKKHIDVIYYNNVEIERYFIPYKLLDDNKIENIITEDIIKNENIPATAKNIIKEKIRDALNNVTVDPKLTDYIENATISVEPANGIIGITPVLNFQVKYYGVSLIPKLNSIIIKTNEKILYADVLGLDIEVNDKTSETVNQSMKIRWYDLKEVQIDLVTSDGNVTKLVNVTNSLPLFNDSVKIYNYTYQIKHGNNYVGFNKPLPYSSLPKIKISNIKLYESYTLKPPVLDDRGKVIYVGSDYTITNKFYYPKPININMYTDVYKYESKSINLYNTMNIIPLDFKAIATGYYIIKSNIIGDYYTDGVKIEDNILTINSKAVSKIKQSLNNGSTVIIYIIGKDKLVEYKVTNIINTPTTPVLKLINIASDGKPGSIKIITKDDIKVIEGYYNAKIMIGNVEPNKIKIEISALINNNLEKVFECNMNSCTFKLNTNDWVFKNKYYTPSDTKIGYDVNTGSITIYNLPLIKFFDNKIVDKYIMKVTINNDDKENSFSFNIFINPRKINISISPISMKYLTVAPIEIGYSIDYYDLFSKALKENLNMIKLILDNVSIRIDTVYEFSDPVKDMINYLKHDKKLSELFNSGYFAHKTVNNCLYIYPDINYGGIQHPTSYEHSQNCKIVVFLPMISSYTISVQGDRFTSYNIGIKPTRNIIDFKFYTSENSNEVMAGQEIKLKFIIDLQDVPSIFVNEVIKALKNKKEIFDLLLVSPSNTYYKCYINSITIKDDNTIVVSTIIPSDTPQGYYAFNLIQHGLNNLYTPIKTYDYLYKENNLNKFFIKSGLDFTSDLIITSDSNSGTLLYAVNSGELFKLNDKVTIQSYHPLGSSDLIPILNPEDGTFKLYRIKKGKRVFLIYPHNNMDIYVPVVTSFGKHIDELFYYVQNIYLISLNLPGFENYTPENYVDNIIIEFKKGNNAYNININIPSMKKSDAKSLFVYVKKNDKTYYYLPITITPYLMTFNPSTAYYNIKIQMINGAVIERKIRLKPVLVNSRVSNGITHVYSVCELKFIRKPSFTGFTLGKITVHSTNEDNLIVENSGNCDGNYYNVELPINELYNKKISMNDLPMNQITDFILFWNTNAKTEKVDYLVMYSLAGGLIIRFSNTKDTLNNIILYMKADTSIDYYAEFKVSDPDYNLIKQWIKKHGITVKLGNTTFRMIGLKHGSNLILMIYATNENKQAYITININSLTSVGGAKFVFDGKTYYIVSDGVSYTTGTLSNVRIGIK